MRLYFKSYYHFESYVRANEPKEIWLDGFSVNTPYFTFTRYYHKENEKTRFLGEYPKYRLASGCLNDESLEPIFKMGIYCKVTNPKNFTLEQVEKYNDYLDFVRLMAFMKNTVGGVWKDYYKKSQRKMAKYRMCDFTNLAGDLADPSLLRRKISNEHRTLLMGFQYEKIEKDLKAKYGRN